MPSFYSSFTVIPRNMCPLGRTSKDFGAAMGWRYRRRCAQGMDRRRRLQYHLDGQSHLALLCRRRDTVVDYLVSLNLTACPNCSADLGAKPIRRRGLQDFVKLLCQRPSGAAGTELSCLRGLDQQAGSHSGTAACTRKKMKPRRAIRCRQRSTLGKGNAHEEGLNRRVVGRPSWRSSFLGDPGAKLFCGKPSK